jgi:RHS repeat-associated protein
MSTNLSLSAAQIIGRQTFDGLGRQQTVQSGTRVTRFHYHTGQLPPGANTLPDGKRIDFTYEPQLDNQLLSVKVENQNAHQIVYDPRLAQQVSASGELGQQRWSYTASGLPDRDTWAVDDQEHTTAWRHSLNGLLVAFDDASGITHDYQYDAFGRLQQLTVGATQTFFTYDAFSRPATVTTQDGLSGQRMVKTLAYDTLSREHSCTFEVTTDGEQQTLVQSLGYSALDQVISRSWNDGAQQGEETYAYDLRSRLILYTANAIAAPTDPFGNRIVRQVFALNALDGYQQVISEFADGTQDTALFSYAATDPTQVIQITHTHPSWPARIDLHYDACGRLIEDSFGRLITWDAQDRLASVSYQGKTCQYAYDPAGNLTDRMIDETLTRSFFSSGQLTHEQCGDETLSLIAEGSSLFALSKLAAGVRKTTLLGTDGQGSVRIEDNGQLRRRSYTAHGAEPRDHSGSPFGFAGERVDGFTGWLIPGGYRPYDPVLMCFLSPDSESPFGRGGLNPYAYCGGDPVNRVDPDGHSWSTWLTGGLGIALGVAAMVASFGAASPAIASLYAVGFSALTASGAMAISAATLSAISLGTGVASMILEATGHDEKAASILGWVSLGTGLFGVGLEMAPAAASRLSARAARGSGRAGSRLAAAPASPRVAHRIGKADVLFEKKPGSSDVAFIERLWDDDYAAFVTHGSPFGQLMNAQGNADSAINVATHLIAPRLAAMGYPEGQKIVLLACWAGKTGAAQNVANVLKRPVEAYRSKIHLLGVATLQGPARVSGKLHGGATTAPVTKISVLKRVFGHKHGPFSDAPHFKLASKHLYTPQ